MFCVTAPVTSCYNYLDYTPPSANHQPKLIDLGYCSLSVCLHVDIYNRIGTNFGSLYNSQFTNMLYISVSGWNNWQFHFHEFNLLFAPTLNCFWRGEMWCTEGSQLPPCLISLDKMWSKLVYFECLHPLLWKALNWVWFLDKTVL